MELLSLDSDIFIIVTCNCLPFSGSRSIFRETYLMTSAVNSVSEPLNLKIFWGRIPVDPPKRLVPSALAIMPPRYRNLVTALCYSYVHPMAMRFLINNRPFALRDHETSFLWKWKLYDFAFEKRLVGHISNKIMWFGFSNPHHFLKVSKFVAGHVTKMWLLKLSITSFWTQVLHLNFK